MPVVAFRRAAFEALSPTAQKVVRQVVRRLDLGEPARYLGPGGEWLMFCDTRFELDDAAYLATVAANVGQIVSALTSGVDKQRVREAVESHVVMPEVPEGVDRWQAVLAANGAPAALRMGDHVPEGFTPVEESE